MADLTIRGAGIFGLSIAWEALSRGATVRIIDPNGPGAGSSGGLVGALQPHTPDNWNAKKQFQFESLILAERFWADVEATSGLSSGYGRVGRIQPLLKDRDVELAKSRALSAQKLWQGKALWGVVDAGAMDEFCPPSPIGLYIHDTLSAILHPRHAITALAEAIRLRGGEILSEGEDSGPVIWATGWQGLKALNQSLDREIGNGVKGQAALIKHDASGAPQVFADGIHFIPHHDGTLGIGSTSEREFDDATTTDDQLDDLILHAYTIMPVLKGARVIDRWAGVRPRAVSRSPLLDAWPDRPGHFVANGGFKIGFGVAPKVAELMVDLVLEGRDAVPEDFRMP